MLPRNPLGKVVPERVAKDAQCPAALGGDEGASSPRRPWYLHSQVPGGRRALSQRRAVPALGSQEALGRQLAGYLNLCTRRPRQPVAWARPACRFFNEPQRDAGHRPCTSASADRTAGPARDSVLSGEEPCEDRGHRSPPASAE
ncbi:hypothetical protein P7K49_010916 [Saguinus oedipus]|uniref:Uncharacterized protein n=1 Tax=Saguinus oedipus TaxID=9490 RepID=A0ABQ9VP61_SAGOE|nr:hypothetical protein P7K49_010916 [Saguinus oedipus]